MTPFRTRVLYSESGVFQNISTNDIIANNLLYLSGDQSVSGLKSFEQRPSHLLFDHQHLVHHQMFLLKVNCVKLALKLFHKAR